MLMGGRSRLSRRATVRMSLTATHMRRLGRRERAVASARVSDLARPSPLLDSQCLADADAIRAVTGPRVQLLCVDASPRLVVFGSSIGSVYVFERRTRGGEALDTDTPNATDATDVPSPVAAFPSSDGPEDGNLKFIERFMVETFAGGSASRPVTRLRLNEQRTRCVLAFDDGEVVVVAFADPLHATMGSRDDRPSSGRYEAGISNGHKGANVTSVAWSASGDALISGDDAGVLSVVRLEGPSADAHTVRFDAPIVQAAFACPNGDAAFVSTTTQLSLLHRANGFKKTPVGAKPRDGAFGASAHALTRAAAPAETLAQLRPEAETSASSGADASIARDDANAMPRETNARREYWMFGARPGRRLWVCRAATEGERSEATVLATVRPSVPEASASPGSREAPLAERRAATSGVPTPPKKWEFGALHALGPCVLSASEKAIAVVDVVSAAVLAWYPLAPPRGKGSEAADRARETEVGERRSEGMGAPRDLATCGARAFVLGADGGVWVLRAPANEARLAAASAALAREARRGVRRASGETTKETSSETDPAAHLERIERRIRSVVAPPPSSPAAADAPGDAAGEGFSAARRGPRPPSSLEPPERCAPSASGGAYSGPETNAPTSPSTEIGFITRARNARDARRTAGAAETASRAAASPPAPAPPDKRPTSPFPVIVDGVVVDVVTEKSLRLAERSVEGNDGGASRGAAAEAPVREENRIRDDDDDEARVVRHDAGASEPGEADRALFEDALVLEEESAREESAPSPSRMVESEDTPASSEGASLVSEVSEVSGDRDRDRDRPPPPRVKTQPDTKDAASPTSPVSSAGSAFSAPDSPQATETNQLFPADPNPWWMRLIGCGSCGPVRTNKQEKSGTGMRW